MDERPARGLIARKCGGSHRPPCAEQHEGGEEHGSDRGLAPVRPLVRPLVDGGHLVVTPRSGSSTVECCLPSQPGSGRCGRVSETNCGSTRPNSGLISRGIGLIDSASRSAKPSTMAGQSDDLRAVAPDDTRPSRGKDSGGRGAWRRSRSPC